MRSMHKSMKRDAIVDAGWCKMLREKNKPDVGDSLILVLDTGKAAEIGRHVTVPATRVRKAHLVPTNARLFFMMRLPPLKA